MLEGASRSRVAGSDVRPAFEFVNELTQAFAVEPQRSAQSQPSIVQYIGKVKEGLKPALLRNLLQVDIQRRRLKGEHPAVEDYLEWFPKHESLIRQEFLESTSIHRSTMSSAITSSSGTAPVQSDVRRPAASRLGDYHLIKELGRGGMGWVFEAVHAERKEHVALKVLPNLTAESLHRFKLEFRSVADVNHPNLIGLHSLDCDGEQWFFTMDLVDGQEFSAYVRPNGILDVGLLRSAFRQLVSGVIGLHTNHVIHRDLKPSNVMVDRDGRVILLDFGLVLDADPSAATHTSLAVAGTPAYMSPEQAAGRSVAFACDWYATGVVLYEALSGNLPYSGSVMAILKAKQDNDPPAIESSSETPHDLCDLAMRLLSRNPKDRPDAMEITRMLTIVDSGAKSSPVNEPHHRLVGRDTQLFQMQQAFDGFRECGSPFVVFIDGRSGEGKTSLCEAFLQRILANPQYAVMSGRCYDRESVPFKALDSTVDAICQHLNRLSDADVAALLPRDVSILARVFPVIGRVKAVADAPQVRFNQADEQEVRTRAFAALRDLLGSISDRKPVVLFVDDLQWGDADSAEILLQVLRSPGAPQVFFIGTYRTDEADDSRFLQAWEEFQEKQLIELGRRNIGVGPLTLEQCVEMVVDQLQQDTPEIRRRAAEFHTHTGGNAFLILELIGCFDPNTNSFRSMPIHQVIDEKLSRLPAEAKPLLEATAIAGQAVDSHETSVVAGFPSVPVATLSRMRSERLIRFLGSDQSGRIDTYHDRIRETVLAEMPVETKTRLHLALAEHLEASGAIPDDWLNAFESGQIDDSQITQLLPKISHRLFDLSFHFDKASDARRACVYAFLAANQSRQQFSLEIAVDQYEVARKNAGHCPEGTRYRIDLGLGDCLRLLGRYSEAEEVLQEAHSLADSHLDGYEVEHCLAELAKGDGRYGDSAKQYTETLAALGVSVPQSPIGLVFGIAKQVLVQLSHSCIRTPKPNDKTTSAEALLRNRMLAGYTMSIWFRNTPSVIWSATASLNDAERSGPCLELTTAKMLHGMICCVAGFPSRGIRYLHEVESELREDDLHSQLLMCFYWMGSYFSLAEYERCKEFVSRGLKLVERTGDIWRALILQLHATLSDYRLGDLRAALEASLEGFQTSIRLGDPNTAHDYINNVAMLSGGRFDFPSMKASLKLIPDNYQATNQLLLAEAKWHLYCGRTAEGLQRAREALDLVRKHVVVNHITAPTFPLVMEAIRLHASAIAHHDPATAKRLIRRGCRQALLLTAFAKKSPAYYPQALRERANLLVAEGKYKKAEKLYAACSREAEAQDSKYESALADLALAECRVQLGCGHELDIERAHERVLKFEQPLEELFAKHPLLQWEPRQEPVRSNNSDEH